MKIYSHQKEALHKLNLYFQNSNNSEIALVVLPTGAGKSGIAAMAPYMLNSKRVLVITPSIEISRQLYNAMCGNTTDARTFYVERELIDDEDRSGFVENADQILNSITSQTFSRRAKNSKLVIANAHKFGAHSNVDIGQIPKNLFDTVIVDEAHHYTADTWKGIINHFSSTDQQPRVKKVFLTATPFKRLNNELVPILDDQQEKMAYELKREDAIAAGIIRGLEFIECGTTANETKTAIYNSVIQTIAAQLTTHDALNNFIHQAMILTLTTSEADDVEKAYNSHPSRLGNFKNIIIN